MKGILYMSGEAIAVMIGYSREELLYHFKGITDYYRSKPNNKGLHFKSIITEGRV